MRILIMDDELPALNLLTDTVREIIPHAEIISLRRISQFQELENKKEIDIAFFDIELGRISGIKLALELKQSSPLCNIIFVTAYEKYAADSFCTRPSGYVVKPFTTEDIRRELEDLRHPLPDQPCAQNKLKIITFGIFKVYDRNGDMLCFTRTYSKEILAYLVDQAGFPVTSKDIASDVLEESYFDDRVSKRVSKLVNLLIEDLSNAGFPNVVIKQNRHLQINKDAVDCDLYKAIAGDMAALNSFHGEYMLEYSWAEFNDITEQLAD